MAASIAMRCGQRAGAVHALAAAVMLTLALKVAVHAEPLEVAIVSLAEDGGAISGDPWRIEARLPAVRGGEKAFATAAVSQQDQILHLVHLRDDGAAPDERAGDGLWTGVCYPPLRPGGYSVTVKGWLGGRVGYSEPSALLVRRAPSRTPWLVAATLALAALLGLAWWAGRRSGVSPALQPRRERGALGAAETEAQLARRLFRAVQMAAVQLPTMRRRLDEGADLQARDVMDIAWGFVDGLQNLGFERIGTVGETTRFDPALHAPAGDEDLRPGDEVVVAFPGYRYGGDVIRHAMVRPIDEAGESSRDGGAR